MHLNLDYQCIKIIYIYIERERERARGRAMYKPHGNHRPKIYNRCTHIKEKEIQT